MRLTILFHILYILVHLASANVPPEKFQFKITYDEKSKMAKISAFVKQGTYFSFGFGSTMKDTGMILLQAGKSNGTALGLMGHGSDGLDAHKTPRISKSLDFTYLSHKVAGGYNFTVWRPLKTKNEENSIIKLDKPFNMIWAASLSTSKLKYHDGGFGEFQVLISSPTKKNGANLLVSV